MQVDSTKVIVDKSEDTFKKFGPSIVGNNVDYNSSIDEEKEEEKQKEEELCVEKLVESLKISTKVETISVPAVIENPTQAVVVSVATQLDDEEEALNLISSLRKLFE